MTDLYASLSAHFETHHKLRKGGAELDYLTGEQVITRLNTTLGVDGWSFEVPEHGQLGEDFWARGRLTAYFPERTVVREQFGGVTSNRGMAPADTLKGAATDALKKCASLIGVGLYLSDKDDLASHAPAPARQAPAPATTPPSSLQAPSAGGAATPPGALAGGARPVVVQSAGDFWQAAGALLACNPTQTATAVAHRLGQEAALYKAQHGLTWSNVYALLEANVWAGEPIPGAPPSVGGAAEPVAF